ncbi:MAG: efflux RND transporter periplasmic adaptor subunit [Asticcacaulis sp.]
MRAPVTTGYIRHFLIVAALTTGLAACHGSPEKAEEGGQKPLIDYVVAESRVAPLIISGSGTVSAWQEAPVGAEVGGLTATAVLADEGQYVTKGQPLLKMNDAVLQAQLRQADAGVQSARAQAVEAERAFQRAKELFDKGFYARAALDQREASMKTAQAQVATAEAARSEVATRLSQATVRAPISGLITSRTAVAGQIVNPGEELFRIVRDNRIEMNLEVVETALSRLSAGQSAEVVGENGETVTGTIRVVTPVVDPQTRLGYARISIPADKGLKPGMFARASITVGNHEAVVVPQKAIIYQQNQPVVFIVGPQNKVAVRKLVTDGLMGDQIIISDGLKVGEKVVTAGAGFLSDGDTVRVPDKPKVQSGGER